jgi:hypothetical protein
MHTSTLFIQNYEHFTLFEYTTPPRELTHYPLTPRKETLRTAAATPAQKPCASTAV